MGQAHAAGEGRHRGAPRRANRGRGLSVEQTLARTASEEGGRLLALLADRLGDIALAQDALQEALLRAAAAWPESGAPREPAGWLFTVARNWGIDQLRKERTAARTAADAAVVAGAPEQPWPGDAGDEPLIDDDAPPGAAEQLRLMLLCCHPALDRDSQIALTLRLAGGLTTKEIAAALLVPEPTLGQRIVRAKRKIRDARIPLRMPAEVEERASLLADVLGFIFNEAYVARTDAAGTLLRADLAERTIRLTAIAADELPDQPELAGLLALQLLVRAREAARTAADGSLIRIQDQDRSLWDRADIARGVRVLAVAGRAKRPGPWQVHAAIAAEHAIAATAADVPWARIVRLYDLLLAMRPSPVVALNRAVAVAEVEGPEAALGIVMGIAGLERYHLWHATIGELEARLGRYAQAADAWLAAAKLTGNPAERAWCERQAAAAAEHTRDLGT